jgi:hypothetical protein
MSYPGPARRLLRPRPLVLACLAACAMSATASAQGLVAECDSWLREAEVCLRDTQQLTPAKREALQAARAQFMALSGGEPGSGPRQRLAAQCRAISEQLAEQRKAGSRSCTI